jgi:hypothetical protein
VHWIAAHRRRISLGASIVLVAIGTAVAFAVTVWGLLPRRPVASRWDAAGDLIEILSGPAAGPGWFVAPLFISTAALFPLLVLILARVRSLRLPWIGSAAAGVLFGLAATSITGFLLGAELALWLPADPTMSLAMRLLLPPLGAAMAPPVALLLLPLQLILGSAFYGLLVAAFVAPDSAAIPETSPR